MCGSGAGLAAELETKLDFHEPIASEKLSALLRKAAAVGLIITIERSVARLAGPRHWHLKRSGKKGALEVSALPDGRRWCLCYHTDRVGGGSVAATAQPLADRLAAAVAAKQAT